MRVVVIGAGYAGTAAANRVAKKAPHADVTVVNPRPDFVERIRLHQHTAGTGTAATPLTSMLHPRIATRVGTVRRVADGEVELADGGHLGFDYALIAVGSSASPLPGTIGIGTWEGAEQARTAVAALSDGARVTVIGGGLTGIETASEIAEARPELRVRLVGETVGASLSAPGRAKVRTAFDRLGVEVVEDTLSEAPSDTDVAVWAVIGTAPNLCADSGLRVDRDGRAVVDKYLRSVSDQRIFVLGDCAAVPGSRMSCQAANPQGIHAGNTLVRMAAGRAPEPFSLGFVGQAVSLGRRDALIQLARRDDSVLPLYLAGGVGVRTKEALCRGAKWAARTTAFRWLPGTKR